NACARETQKSPAAHVWPCKETPHRVRIPAEQLVEFFLFFGHCVRGSSVVEDEIYFVEERPQQIFSIRFALRGAAFQQLSLRRRPLVVRWLARVYIETQ